MKNDTLTVINCSLHVRSCGKCHDYRRRMTLNLSKFLTKIVSFALRLKDSDQDCHTNLLSEIKHKIRGEDRHFYLTRKEGKD